MDHPLINNEPDQSYTNESLRTALYELNQVLEGLKDQPSTQPFAKATASVEPLGPFNANLERQFKTDQKKILKTEIMSQGAGTTEKSILSVGQSGTALCYDIESGLRYEALNVGGGHNLALSSSPQGGVFACGGLACCVDIYPINEALQSELGIKRPEHNFNFVSEPREVKQEPYDVINEESSTSGIEALIKNADMPPRNPKEIRIQRELIRVDPEDALKKVKFEPKVARSDRYAPLGTNAVTSLHASFMGHKGSIHALKFMTDYRLLSGAADAAIIDWDISTGQPLHLCRGHQGAVNDICKVDENTFVSVGSDGYILLWDNRTYSPQLSFECATDGFVNGVESIARGMCFAAIVNNSVGFFDIRTVNNLFHVQAENMGELTTIGSSASGRVVVVGDQNGTCSVLDVLRGQWKGGFRAHNETVTSTHIWEDSIFTASFDSTIKLWKHQSSDLE